MFLPMSLEAVFACVRLAAIAAHIFAISLLAVDVTDVFHQMGPRGELFLAEFGHTRPWVGDFHIAPRNKCTIKWTNRSLT